jgi:phosphoketolase
MSDASSGAVFSRATLTATLAAFSTGYPYTPVLIEGNAMDKKAKKKAEILRKRLEKRDSCWWRHLR